MFYPTMMSTLEPICDRRTHQGFSAMAQGDTPFSSLCHLPRSRVILMDGGIKKKKTLARTESILTPISGILTCQCGKPSPLDIPSTISKYHLRRPPFM